VTTERAEHEHNAEVVPLRAAPDQVGEPAAGPPVYADVTNPGERKPVLPAWLASAEGAKHHARRAGGHARHSARYHGLRSPLYLAVTLGCAVVGVVRLAARWLRWWLMPVPPTVYADVIADGHRAWHRTHSEHKQTAKVRACISVIVVLVAWFAGTLATRLAPWWVWPPAAALVLVLARHGRGEGRRIVQPARMPAGYEVLTLDVVTRALASLNIPGITRRLKEGRDIDYTSPVKQDGPGFRVSMNLPYGVTATQIIDKRSEFASGLRRPSARCGPSRSPRTTKGRLTCGSGSRTWRRRKPRRGRWPRPGRWTSSSRSRSRSMCGAGRWPRR